jgi:hypothetical protein
MVVGELVVMTNIGERQKYSAENYTRGRMAYIGISRLLQT